jgi:CRISPR/Cas system-associated exonuclease Cas4 (RecB family)
MADIPQVQFKGSWSFSGLMNYEACPLRFKLKRIDRMPEKPQPPDSPLERGNREHKRYEEFVKGERSSLDDCEAREYKQFVPLLEHARDLHAVGKASTEEDWFFDADWNACERNFEERTLMVKLDLSVRDEENAVVTAGDYKTGRSQYKSYEHATQTQLYAGVSALKFEWANIVTTELWYVDEGHIKPFTYTREQALMYIGRFQKRIDVLYADRYWRPNPNKENCRWCPYGPRNGTGVCPVGV